MPVKDLKDEQFLKIVQVSMNRKACLYSHKWNKPYLRDSIIIEFLCSDNQAKSEIFFWKDHVPILKFRRLTYPLLHYDVKL